MKQKDVESLVAEAVSKFNDTALEIVKQVSTGFILPIFNKFAFVDQVSWTQYTDYWNDGEPCYFSAPRGVYIYLNQERFHYEDLDCPDVRDLVEVNTPGSNSGTIDALIDALTEDLDTLDNVLHECSSVLKVIGDHTEVVVDRTGTITTLDYTDHG